MEQTLGKRIVSHRKRLGLTQDQLADRLGVTAQAVSKWENDQSCPDINTLPRLAEIFGITTDELLGREAPAFVGEVDEEKNGIHFEVDTGEKTHSVRPMEQTVWLAIYLLALAGLLLVTRLLEMPVGFWTLAWTSALIVFGLESVVREGSVIGLATLLVGAYFLADGLNVLPVQLTGKLVLPLCLLALGVCLLIRALTKKHPKVHVHIPGKKGNSESEFRCDDGGFMCANSFGEKRFQVSEPVLRGGKVDSAFGKTTVDLQGCGTVAPGCAVDARCAFGQLTLLVPRHLRAEVRSETAFADVHVRGNSNPDAAPFTLNAECSFGEIRIEYV